nr:hypothetical protein [Tanacetum cinerariifolium]
MDSIEQCIVERASHEQEIQNGLKRLNERKLQIQVQEVKASNASLGDKDCEPMVEVPYTTEYIVFAIDTQHSEQSGCIINTCVVEKVDSNVIPDSSDMCDNDIQTDQNAEDERAALANLIANLKLDIDENKTIQKQLKRANASLTQELKECESTLAKTTRTLGESNSIRGSCLVALQSKQTEFERYKAFNDRTKKDTQSHKTTKRYIPIEKKCDSKKHDIQIPIGQRFSPNKSSNVYLKTTPPRSGLTWKPTSRIFTQVSLKWIPIRKSVETRYNMNNSASPLGKETHNPKTVICVNSASLSAGTSMASEPSPQRVLIM